MADPLADARAFCADRATPRCERSLYRGEVWAGDCSRVRGHDGVCGDLDITDAMRDALAHLRTAIAEYDALRARLDEAERVNGQLLNLARRAFGDLLRDLDAADKAAKGGPS